MKKLLPALLATALLFALLTACGKTEPAKAPSAPLPNTQTAEEFKQDLMAKSERANSSTTASSKTSEPAASGKYCGSRNSDVFHYPSCSSAERIKDSNLVWFKDLDAAYDRGYRPCQRCTPD